MNFSLSNFTDENVTNRPYQDFNDSYLDDINSYLFGIVSLFSNSLLIYATSQVKSYTNSVRWTQYSMCISRLIFSLSIVLTSPSIEYMYDTESLYIIKNGIDLPLVVGETLLGMFIVSIVMSCNGPAAQYIQVAVLLSSNTKKQLNYAITSIPIIVAIPTVTLVYFGYVPHFYNVKLANYLIELMDVQGTAAFLIVTAHLASQEGEENHFDFDMMSQVCTLFILMVMASSLLIVSLCYWRIRRQMKCRSVMNSSTNQSTQEQLNTVLLIQFIFPFLTIHIPFYITFILPFFNNEVEFLTDNMIYLFAWCPAINPLFVMIVVKNIREVILRKSSIEKKTSSIARVVLATTSTKL